MRVTMTRGRGVAVMAGALLVWGVASTGLAAQPATIGLETAADRPTVSAGLSIVTLAGSFDYARGGGSQSAQMNWGLSYGYLLTDHLALGGGITTHTDWEDTTDTTTSGEVSVGPRFFLPTDGRLHPYLGLRFGLGFGKDDNSVSGGAGLGVMYLLGNKRRGAGIVAEALYAAEKTSDQTNHRVMVALGLTLYFR
jgi:hypothetical protein